MYCEDAAGKNGISIIKSEKITQTHQEYNGHLNFATDAWTSPNHKAFVAISVHLEHEGVSIAMVLDIVEVPEVKFRILT